MRRAAPRRREINLAATVFYFQVCSQGPDLHVISVAPPALGRPIPDRDEAVAVLSAGTRRFVMVAVGHPDDLRLDELLDAVGIPSARPKVYDTPDAAGGPFDAVEGVCVEVLDAVEAVDLPAAGGLRYHWRSCGGCFAGARGTQLLWRAARPHRSDPNGRAACRGRG